MTVCFLQFLKLKKTKCLYFLNQRLHRGDIVILLHGIEPLYIRAWLHRSKIHSTAINHLIPKIKAVCLLQLSIEENKLPFFLDQLLFSCATDILSIQPCPSVQWFNFQQQIGYISCVKPLIESRRKQTAVIFQIRCFIAVISTFYLFNLALQYYISSAKPLMQRNNKQLSDIKMLGSGTK